MELKNITEQLGFVVIPNGKILAFGEYKSYESRDENNPHQFHASAFKIDVESTPEWKQLGLFNGSVAEKIKAVKKDASLLAQLGLVVALNISYEICDIYVPYILFVSPEIITEEQATALMETKEQLLIFDKGKRIINIIDKDRNEIDRPETIEEYYEKYIEPRISEKSPKR